MRAIRAWHRSMTYYGKIFRDITGLSLTEYLTLKRSIVVIDKHNFDCTDRFTSMREQLANLGYEKEVAKADERFLAEHCGFPTQESWERFWQDFCANHNLDPRKDAL